MEFLDVVSARRSVRRFRDEPVAEEQLAKILEVCRAAPSAGNLQGYRIVVVRDPRRRQELAEAAYGQSFAAAAPVCLAFIADFPCVARRYGDRAELYAVQDATIAATHAVLAITDLGLASCWIGAFDDEKMARALGVPQDCRPVAVLAVGHPDEAPGPRPRRELADLVREGSFDGRPYSA